LDLWEGSVIRSLVFSPVRQKSPFYKEKGGGSVIGTLFWAPRGARLFRHCLVGGHCSVIWGGGLFKARGHRLITNDPCSRGGTHIFHGHRPTDPCLDFWNWRKHTHFPIHSPLPHFYPHVSSHQSRPQCTTHRTSSRVVGCRRVLPPCSRFVGGLAKREWVMFAECVSGAVCVCPQTSPSTLCVVEQHRSNSLSFKMCS